MKDTFPIPRVEDLVDQTQRCRLFSSLDSFQAYYQIPIEESEVYKTAFRTKRVSFEFKVMPFGLTNAPSSFQRIISNVLREYWGRFVVVYLNGICIYSKTEEDNLEDVAEVLKCLNNANPVLRPDKGTFGRKDLGLL